MAHAWRIRVRGLVQGVGFRPNVWRLAREEGLRGWVRNDGDGVEIAVSGSATALAAFRQRLRDEAPPLARIDEIVVQETEIEDWPDFAIVESAGGAVRTAIGPDAAICEACAAEICDPAHRRWRYAFTTCTHCGPRYTVSRGIPYDRVRTSLDVFPLCPSCQTEYTNPADRRFHAETTCCPECGPRLWLEDAAEIGDSPRFSSEKRGLSPISVISIPSDPIAEALSRLRSGCIVAIKGLGGFHLACDARNPAAVAELRRRKQRDEKPFAVMGLNPQSFRPFAQVSADAAALLQSAAAPIVLCPRNGKELAGIAPGLAWLGLMLPATPLHRLLWHEAAGRPAGIAWAENPSELLLVMTSANPNGEPLVIGNDEARTRLAGIADAFLMHDREIVVRCDDSVVGKIGDRPQFHESRNCGLSPILPSPVLSPRFIRRARGYTPVPIALADDGPAVLAFGAFLKNTVCLSRGREAFVSQHIGGLDNAAAISFLEETVAHLLAILDVRPAWVAHDLHPDYPSTRLAAQFAAENGLPALAVGHHHAHVAAILAEHRVDEPVIGLALDGVGLGPDGGLWGGELLRVDGAECRRLGHLPQLALPGGDRAAREPWRMAGAALHALGRTEGIADFIRRRHPGRDGERLAQMLARGLNSPTTSSLGRWFDAASGLLGLRAEMRFEGQAAMELEGLATAHGPADALTCPLTGAGEPDLSGLLAFLADCHDPAEGAAVFHATLAQALADWAAGAARREGLSMVACGGGCAMNRVLMQALRKNLVAQGLELLEAQQLPPNDGGLSLGQAWVARARSAGSTDRSTP